MQDPLANVERYLSGRNLSLGRLLEEVDDVFGEPQLVAATGSVPAGYANGNSDVDVYVIVESDDVTGVPVMSYVDGVRIEVVYLSDAEWRARMERAGQPAELSAGPWSAHRRAVEQLCRFGTGAILGGNDAHRGWWQQQCVEAACTLGSRWWAGEAVRRVTAARWFAQSDPQLSRIRTADAALAAGEALAARAGEAYFNRTAKWVGEKAVRLSGSAVGEQIGELVRHGIGGDDDTTIDLVMTAVEQTDDVSPRLELFWADGCEVTASGASTWVTRFKMRGAKIPIALNPSKTEPLWSGSAGEMPPEELLALFRADMLWLGARA